MTDGELEERIVLIVEKNPNLTTMRIINKLWEIAPGLSESQMSHAVWRLIDSGRLQLTDDCGIEKTPKRTAPITSLIKCKCCGGKGFVKVKEPK